MDEDEAEDAAGPTQPPSTTNDAVPLPPVDNLPPPTSGDDDPIPSNAIEMVNAPQHAEDGLGDLGKSGVEVNLPMEKEGEVGEIALSGAGGTDEGLVMGEMDAPSGAEGSMVVDGEKGEGAPEIEI
jgi:hypothetical protein